MFFKNSQKGSNQWYLYVAMMIAIFIATQIGSLVSLVMMHSAIKNDPSLGEEDIDNFYSDPDFSVFGIDAVVGFILLLLPFILGFLVLYFAFPLLHKRKFTSLISGTEKIDWSRIFFGFFVWLILSSMLEFTYYLQNPDIFSFQFNLVKFLPLLFVSLLILPIQTSLEELIFRSYLLQGFSNLNVGTKNQMIIFGWITTSILFGRIHMANPEVQSYGELPMMIYYIGAGLFLGLITIWDDRLELALGVHAATNFISAVIIGYDGAAIQTDSIFKISELNVWFASLGFYVLALIFTFICKRKYGWTQLLRPELNT